MIFEIFGSCMSTKGILSVLSAVLAIHYLFKWQRGRRLPPGPWAWPVLGHMPHLAMHRHQYDLLTRWARTYGNVYMVYLGSRPAVVVNGWDAVREALVEKGHHFANRPNWLYTPKEIFKCKGILWSNGHSWRQLRKFTSVSLRDFGVGKKSLEEKVRDQMNLLAEILDNTEGKLVAPNRFFERFTFNVIWIIVFGQRDDEDEADIEGLLDMLTFMFRNAGTHIPEDFLPWLRFIPLRSPAAPLIKNDQRIKKFIRKQIEKHRLTFDPENIQDYTDLYLSIVDEKTTDILTEENIFRVIIDLFLAGSETTSILMTWATLYFAKFPDVQRKCQEEIDGVLGSEGTFFLADKERLPYTMATVTEIHRHCNVVPAIPPHSVVDEVKLGSYVLPQDTIVLFNLQSVHHDKKYWEKPELFNPERWLDEDGSLMKREAFIPFSIGPRACLGEWLARLEVIHVLVNLLHKFVISTPGGPSEVDLSPALQAVTNHPRPFKIGVTRRDNSD